MKNTGKNANVLITAGGTSEAIDNVRRITNSGTGRLGALVAEAFAASGQSCRLTYICSSGAVRPDIAAAQAGSDAGGPVLDIRLADDVNSVRNAVRAACSERAYDIIIHSMAIGDYTVRAVSDASLIAHCAAGRFSAQWSADFSLYEEKIRETLFSPPPIREAKISSDKEDLVVILEKAPKVIALYRGLAPDAVIVGFKLLSDTDEAALVDAGLGLLEKNDCDFVLANDMRTVRGDFHEGLLIARDGSYERAVGKGDIAALIVKRALAKLP